eukprot:13912448-Ditylum_brightwellii.AAC.1
MVGAISKQQQQQENMGDNGDLLFVFLVNILEKYIYLGVNVERELKDAFAFMASSDYNYNLSFFVKRDERQERI